MSLKRVLILTWKELSNAGKGFLIPYMIIAPIVLSLLVTLVFGELFSEKPELGYVDAGNPEFASLLDDAEFVNSHAYESEDDLTQAVESGAVDIGFVVPTGFDRALQSGDMSSLSVYVWGESLLKNQIILTATLDDLMTTLAGFETPVSVEPVVLGDEESRPIEDRMMPFLVLMAVVLGGMMVPAVSLVEEKERRTLKALVITPASLDEVFLAKGVFGVCVSLVMASIILVLNGALGSQTALLLLVLLCSAITAAAFGLLFGAFVKDTTTLMAIVKATGLLLYAPGLLQIFPDIPSWIAKVFPTYYMIGPVMTITQEGGGWSDVVGELAVLVALGAALVVGAAWATRRIRYQLA